VNISCFRVANSFLRCSVVAAATVVSSACADSGSAAPALTTASNVTRALPRIQAAAAGIPTPCPSQPGETCSVDVRPYIAATIGGTDAADGQKLCTPTYQFCHTSVLDGGPYGEVNNAYSWGGYDYVGISSYDHTEQYVGTPLAGASPYYIGVIRDLDGSSGPLRCYSYFWSVDTDEECTSPSDSVMIPGGVPITILNLPVLSWATVEATQPGTPGVNDYPTELIPGTLITTPNTQYTQGQLNFWSFGVWYMAQPYVGTPRNCTMTAASGGAAYPTKVGIAYVKNVPFGETIGTQDALVIDTVNIGSSTNIERSFYVAGYGKVWQLVGTNPTSSSQYSLLFDEEVPMSETTTATGTKVAVIPMTEFSATYSESLCPQGSYQSLL
jgi:hypothetical protein